MKVILLRFILIFYIVYVYMHSKSGGINKFLEYTSKFHVQKTLKINNE